MPVPTSWSDLRRRRVGVWGLGVEGQAAVRRCAALGIEPVLVDDALPAVPGALATAEGGLEALLRCDTVVKTPGISRYRADVAALEAAGVEVVGGLGLWLAEADRDRVVLVTGTKGKSTTTAVTAHLLAGLGRRPLACGNFGVAPYDPAAEQDPDYWVVEVSSYQAADLEVSTPVVAVTSLHPDHLPWHRNDVLTYYRDKLSICRLPGADLVVANGDSAALRRHAQAEQLLGGHVRWVHDSDAPGSTWTQPLGPGRHNRRNALIAQQLLLALGVSGASDEARLAAAAMSYSPLEHRLQEVRVVAGVTFVDDTLSTNVLPTLAALDAYADRRVALIVGGQDRGIDYTELALGLRLRDMDTLVLTVPDNGERVAATLTSTDPGPATQVRSCADEATAIRAGFDWARDDGVVLLSPAAASFGQFANYRARSAAFRAVVASLAADATGPR